MGPHGLEDARHSRTLGGMAGNLTWPEAPTIFAQKYTAYCVAVCRQQYSWRRRQQAPIPCACTHREQRLKGKLNSIKKMSVALGHETSSPHAVLLLVVEAAKDMSGSRLARSGLVWGWMVARSRWRGRRARVSSDACFLGAGEVRERQ